MSDQDTWIRVPVNLLARFLDCLNQIDCINAGLIRGDISHQVKTGQDAFAEFLDKHNANNPNPAVIPSVAAMHFLTNHVLNDGDTVNYPTKIEVTNA